MTYFCELLRTVEHTKPPGLPLGDKPADICDRISEASRLTTLIEVNGSFSFVRLGDMDLGLLLGRQDGIEDVFGDDTASEGNGTQRTGGPGIGASRLDRLYNAFCNSDYVDFHQRLWPIGPLLPRLRLDRPKHLHCNPDIETSYILLTWVEAEFANYCSRHRVGFVGSEAALMQTLLEDPRFPDSGRLYWPNGATRYFHQVRNNGKTIDADLDLIKNDVIDFVRKTGIDTIFVSLGGAAKILCYELAKEINIRAIDFGAMLRGLCYVGSDGQNAARATHSPFFYRIPFDVVMDAMDTVMPSMKPEERLARTHAQLLLELQPHIVGWTFTGELDPIPELQRERFLEAFRQYKKRMRSSFSLNTSARKERAGFLHYCGQRRLTFEGTCFYKLFQAKVFARKLAARMLLSVSTKLRSFVAL